MYRIVNIATGEEIGKVDKPIYIRVKESTGARIQLKAGEGIEAAQGIAYKDNAYNLEDTFDFSNSFKSLSKRSSNSSK